MEKKLVAIQLEFSESGYKRLEELVKKAGHISIGDCIITALIEYEKKFDNITKD